MGLNRSLSALLAGALLTAAVLSAGTTAQGRQPLAVTVPAAAIPEGNDYATRVLGNPWDMGDLGDVSYYLNESGQRRIINNPAVSNGVFTGSSFNNAISGDGNANYFPLFPGYIGESASDPLYVPENDLVGANYPIGAGYSCLHVAVRAESPAANNLGPDVLRAYWFADRNLNRAGGVFGQTFVQLYPEAAAGQPTPRWQVISVNLASPNIPVQQGVRWTTRDQWQGLRIDPTAIAAGTNFAIDWVRLTDCNAVSRTISWDADPAVQAVWLRPVGSERDIRIATVSGATGSASVDFQGVEAGTYSVGLGTLTSCCSQRSDQTITINRTPSGRFATPSFTSGVDYATQAGNPWDFRASDDAELQVFTSGTPQPTAVFGSDGLVLTTPPGPLPAGIDVALNLNAPTTLDPNQYRFLSIDMETSWLVPWANIPDGMIGRWVWQIQGTSGRPGFRCTIVGPDIPYDVGRQRILVDLFDPVAGTAEESQGECPAGPLTWRTAPILDLRFDPNENVTAVGDPISGGGPFVQRIRSIRLTQVPEVAAGTRYPVTLSLSEPADQVEASFFYTTNPAQPTQNPAVAATGSPPAGPRRAFLPLVTGRGGTAEVGPNPLTFVWNTAGVTPGTYFLCAQLNDGLNSSTTCSQAPVQVR